jgi:hypothetical protein
MLQGLEGALEQALQDGYKGLWASGDMTWEFGLTKDFRGSSSTNGGLEEFFQKHPELEAVCQYHTDTLPPEAIKQGLTTHPALFMLNKISSIVEAITSSSSTTKATFFDCTENALSKPRKVVSCQQSASLRFNRGECRRSIWGTRTEEYPKSQALARNAQLAT